MEWAAQYSLPQFVCVCVAMCVCVLVDSIIKQCVESCYVPLGNNSGCVTTIKSMLVTYADAGKPPTNSNDHTVGMGMCVCISICDYKPELLTHELPVVCRGLIASFYCSTK